MKLTNVKAMVAKSLTVGLLAGAFVLASPAKADAQQFAIGVQFGTPVYNGYYNGYNDFYARQRYEQIRRQRRSKRNRRMRGSRCGSGKHAYGYVRRIRRAHVRSPQCGSRPPIR